MVVPFAGPSGIGMADEAGRKRVLLREKPLAQVEVPFDLADVRADLPEVPGRNVPAEQSGVRIGRQIEIHGIHAAGDVLADGHAVGEQPQVLGVVDQCAFPFVLQAMRRFAVPHAPQRQLFVPGQLDHGLAAVMIAAARVDRIHQSVSLDAARIGGKELQAFHLRRKLPRLLAELLRQRAGCLRLAGRRCPAGAR